MCNKLTVAQPLRWRCSIARSFLAILESNITTGIQCTFGPLGLVGARAITPTATLELVSTLCRVRGAGCWAEHINVTLIVNDTYSNFWSILATTVDKRFVLLLACLAFY